MSFTVYNCIPQSHITEESAQDSILAPILQKADQDLKMMSFSAENTLLHHSELSLNLDTERAIRISKQSRSIGKSWNRKGLCMKAVRVALTRCHFSTPRHGASNFAQVQTQSADTFRQWATKNPHSLCTHFKLVDIRSSYEHFENREGFIFVYKKGRCGFNEKHGHIEIQSHPTFQFVCSDHCRHRRLACQPDMVLAPVRSCAPLLARPTGFSSTTQESLSEFSLENSI